MANAGTARKFQSEFWRSVKADSAALLVFDKIPSRKQNRVVGLLEAASDPDLDECLKGGAHSVPLLLSRGPSTREFRDLSRRLRTIARDMDRILGPSKLAEDCRLRAGRIRLALAMDDGRPKTPRVLTYKAFWKHLPIVLLCRELDAPSSISFDEVEKLVHCAYIARVDRWTRPARSVERQFNGFMKSKGAQLLPLLPRLVGPILSATK